MGETVDIGRRIELVPMDPHFHDISIALYRQKKDDGPAYLVHTYSRIEGVDGRMTSIVNAMCTLGGLETTADGFLQFPCRKEHGLAIKRVFLEACKLAPSDEIEPRPLHILDKKIIPNGRRDNFEQNTHFSNLTNQLLPLGREIANKCRKSSIARNKIKTFELSRLFW